MATRSLNVVITGNTKSLDQALGQSESKLGKFAKVSAVAGAAVGGALTAGLVKAVSSAADFEAQLDALGAVSDATAAQMETLRKQAIQAGAATKFSALEAAKAQTELAKGGLSLKTILDGGLKGALALAAAGELDLAEAASTTANALNLFKLNGREAGHVADALAQAANSTTADVSDFAMALTQGGAAAKAAGLDLDQTVVGLEALATAGVKGSDAGTSLKAALTQIANPTDKAAEAAKKLGLNFFLANGQMKPLNSIAAELQNSFGNLTQKQRLQAAATIAGTDGMRTILALYDAGPQKVTKYWQELQKEGTAAEVAAKKQDNLKGKLENLKGSMETLAIIVGSKLIPPLTRATEWTTAFLNKLQSGQGTIGGISRWISSAAASIAAFGERVRSTFSGGDQSATGSVQKFASNARELLRLVVNAVTQVGHKVSAVFSDSGIGANLAIIGRAFLKLESVASTVVMFIVKHTIPILVGVIEGLATVIKGVVAIIAGILSGDFGKAWDGAKTIVRGAVKAIVAIVKGLAGLLLDSAVLAGKAIGSGIIRGLGSLGHLILAKAKDALGFVAKNLPGPAGVVGSAIGKLVGDGAGKSVGALGSSLPSGTFGGGLMGARPSLAPFASAASRFGLGVTSGKRPGSITSSGNVSYHSSGEAIDVAGSAGGMLGFFRQMKSKFGARLAELIYTPGGQGVKNGRPFTYGGQVAADHFDHVHLAYDTGVPGVGDGIGRTVSAARSAGFRGDALVEAVAIAGAESGYDPTQQNLKYPDHSIGLWQINQLAHHGRFGTDAQLKNPSTNAKAAYALYKESGFRPWSTYPTAAAAYLERARAAVKAGGSKSSPKSKTRSSGSSSSSGASDAAKNAPVSPTYGGEGATDPLGSSVSARTQGFLDAMRPVKGRGPTKGFPSGYTPPEPTDPPAFVSPFAGELRQLGAAGALAALTSDLGDDIGVAQRVQDIRGGELDLAKQSGDPDRIREAAENFKNAIDALNGLKAATEENTKALQDSIDSLTAEMKRQTDFAKSVEATSNYQLTKTLADLVSGHIVGRGVASRAFTPGSGVEYAY